ncbi:hypothetical protein ACS8FD_23415, partial [Psychrobacter sp. 1U2]
MLNLVYLSHLKGDAVSEQELRNVLGRKELPKWYTYINYLKDCKLITVTEDDEYVLKKDLSKMTLWDFYRTLPYPLPIKDELDEMENNSQQPWLSLLVRRFNNTEAFAQEQLDLPLSAIFSHSQPRKKTSADNKIEPFGKSSKRNTQHNKHRREQDTPHFEAAAYDKDSDVICD